LRWEAASGAGQQFPALDANITLACDGEGATLIGLDGVCRTPPAAPPGQAATCIAAATAVRALLASIAAVISDPVAQPAAIAAASTTPA
jgi:hypothetical protein